MGKIQIKKFSATPEGFEKMNLFLRQSYIEFKDLFEHSDSRWILAYKDIGIHQKGESISDFINIYLPTFLDQLKKDILEKNLESIDWLHIQLSSQLEKLKEENKL
jgi:hypothetical protein